MNKYFEVIGKFEGDLEVLFGSFDRVDCKYEIEAEKTSWKDQGYKGIKIVSRLTDEKPDPTVYENLASKKEVMQIVSDLNEGDIQSYIEDGLITKVGKQYLINDKQLLTEIKKGVKIMSKSSELDRTVKLYILNCASDQAGTNEMMQIIKYIDDRFNAEYHWLVPKVGKVNAMTNWLQGLALNIDFNNYEILKLAVKWQSIPADYSEKQADKILSNYWHFMANKVLQLINNYRLPKGAK